MTLDVQTFVFWLLACLTALCAIATVVSQNIVRSATWLLFTLAGTSGIFFLLGADIVGAIQLLVYVGGTMVLVVFGVMLTAQGPFISMKTSGAEWAISMFAGIMLFAVLCFGTLAYNEEPPAAKISAASWDAKTATITAANAFAPGQTVVIADVTPGGYNGTFRILTANKEGFTYTLETDPDGAGTAFGTAARANTSAPAENPQDSHHSATIGQALLGVGYGPTYRKGNTARPERIHYLLPFEIVSVHLLVVLIGAAYLARAKKRKGETT
jgi:NADH-quinone oxidoreductase subunit J